MKEILKCMDKIPQGVFLVGTKKGEGYNLMTAAFVTQVSFNPASIAVSVANNHYTAELIRELDCPVSYMIVSEAGASVYSASKLAAEEFPQFDRQEQAGADPSDGAGPPGAGRRGCSDGVPSAPGGEI